MSLKLKSLDQKLRQRIERQMHEEDRAKINHSVGALQAGIPKPTPTQALECDKAKQRKCRSRFKVRIAIIQFRRRLLDRFDNLRSSCKGLIDSLAKTVRMDDNDPRIEWSVEQVKTTGEEGCLVRIEYED